MKIAGVQTLAVRVPAKPGMIHSPGRGMPLHMLAAGISKAWRREFDELPKYIIRIRTDDGCEGIGESLRLSSKETLDQVGASLVGVNPLSLNLFDLPIPYGRLYDGFECALLDLVGKLLNRPVFSLLGGAWRDRVACSGWMGQKTPEDAAATAHYFRGLGFDFLKFKSTLEDDPVAQCAAIRETVPGMKLILDPNGRWDRASEALRLTPALRELGNVWCLEDPIPRWDLAGWQHLRGAAGIPLAFHTHIPYVELFQKPQDPVLAWKADALDYFNFSGPAGWVMRMAHFAELVGVPFWHGSELDLGILEACHLHVAAACRMCTLPSDVFGEAIRENDLIEQPLESDGKGHFLVPQGPGLGVKLDEEALRRYGSPD
jgi:muconate cycloisomerase